MCFLNWIVKLLSSFWLVFDCLSWDRCDLRASWANRLSRARPNPLRCCYPSTSCGIVFGGSPSRIRPTTSGWSCWRTSISTRGSFGCDPCGCGPFPSRRPSPLVCGCCGWRRELRASRRLAWCGSIPLVERPGLC